MADNASGVVPASRSSRTLLLTVLGSAVAPRDLVLWRETYVRVLADLGLGEPAARQAVERAVGDGWLTRERVGRRTRLRVPQEHREGLASAAERVAAFGRPFEWNGEWLVVVLKVPEQERAVRHQFRTQLGWLGFGSLGNGVWVSPHTENEQQTLELFAGGEGPQDAYVFRSARIAGGSPEHVAGAAWNMAALRERYDRFLSRFAEVDPAPGADVWRQWIELVTAWRHFPLFDPELPENLLPDDWPRAAAFRLFHRRDARWQAGALEHLESTERGVTA